MPKDVSDSCQLVVRTLFVEVQQSLNDVVGEWEIFPCKIVIPPEFYLIRGIHLLSFLVEVLLRRGKLIGPQPSLVDNFGNQIRTLLLLDGLVRIPIVEGYQL